MRSLVVLALLAVPAAAAPIRAVSFDPFAGICAIDGGGVVRCEKPHEVPTKGLKGRDVAMSGRVVIVAEDGSVGIWDRYGKKLEPIAVPFRVREIEDLGQDLCAVGEKLELACGTPDAGLKLVPAPANTTFVSVAFNRQAVWFLDDKKALWCHGGGNCARMYTAYKKLGALKPIRDPAWLTAYPIATETPKPAPLWRITDGVTRMFVAGDTCIERAQEPNTVTCWDWVQGPEVFPLPTADEVTTSGPHLCTRTKDVVTCVFMNSQRHNVFKDKPSAVNTFTVKGATRMFSGDQLCVAAGDGLVCTKSGGNEVWKDKMTPVTWAAPKQR